MSCAQLAALSARDVDAEAEAEEAAVVETADALLLRLATEPRHGLCGGGMSGGGGGILKGLAPQDEGGHSLRAGNTAKARESPRS